MVRDSVLACALLLASCTEPVHTTLGPVELTEVGPGSLLSWSNPGTRIVARFSGDAHHDRHGIRLSLKQPRALSEDTVVSVRYRVQGWERLDHVAFVLGPRLTYRSRHPDQLRVAEEHYRLEHRYVDEQSAEIPEQLSAIEIQIRGIPGERATFALESVELGEAAPAEFVVDGEFVSARHLVERPLAPLPESVSDALDAYLDNFKRGRTVVERAEAFVRERNALLVGLPPLSFDSLESLDTQIHAATKTHRFRWHSWDLVATLTQAHRTSRESSHREAALSLARAWLDREFGRAPSDPTYVWYDHAAADRLIALNLVFRLAMQAEGQRELAAELAHAIHSHATLMASAWFYSHEQAADFHNHAIFQDIALILTSDLLPTRESAQWRSLGVARLERQLEGLTSDEGVSVENSWGYHLGLAKLCHLAFVFSRSKAIESRCLEMDRVSAAFAYPDGTAPSFGDTRRLTRVSTPSEERTYLRSYPDAGYFVARGGGQSTWQLTFIASSKTETHEHADHLSLSYWQDGVEWLIDPGVYSYEDEPMARYARGPRAHNTPYSDERAYSLKPSSASLEARSSEGEFEVVGVHRAQPGLTVSRMVAGDLTDETLRVRDRVEGRQPGESIRVRFHLGERVHAHLKPGRIELSAAKSETGVTLAYRGLSECRVERGVDGDAPSGWAFPNFLEKTPIVVVDCALTGDEAYWEIRPRAVR